MLKVKGEFVLQSANTETITWSGGTFDKTVVVGHAPTGWPSNMPQSVQVAVEMNKKAVEAMGGNIGMVAPGTRILVEDGYIKASASKDGTKHFPTVVVTKMQVSAANPGSQQHVVQQATNQAFPPQQMANTQPVNDLNDIPF